MKVYTMGVFLATLMAVSFIRRTQALDSSCTRRTIADNSLACFQNPNLPLTVMPAIPIPVMPQYPEFEVFFTILDPQVYCDASGQALETYKNAVECSQAVKKSCMGDLVSDAKYFQDGMQRLCDMKTDVDATCMKTFYNAVHDCFMYKVQALVGSQGTSPKWSCVQSDVHYDCFEVVMSRACGQNTTKIYLEQFDDYQLSGECKNTSRPSRQRPRYFEALRLEIPHDSGPVAMATTIPVAFLAAVAVLSAQFCG